MAKIYGFTLKGIVSYPDTDGITVLANIYYGAKRVGTYTDRGDGSYFPIIEFDGDFQKRKEMEELLAEKAKQFYERFPEKRELKELYSEDQELLNYLVDLVEDEKAYKKGAKDGYGFMFSFVNEQGYLCYIGYRTEEEMNKGLERHKNDQIVKVYKSISDFTVE